MSRRDGRPAKCFNVRQLPITATDSTRCSVEACHGNMGDALVSILPVNPRSLASFHLDLDLLIYPRQLVLFPLSLDGRHGSRLPKQHAQTSACTAKVASMQDFVFQPRGLPSAGRAMLCTMNPDSNACFSRLTRAPFAMRQPPEACTSAAAGVRQESTPD